MQRNDDLNEVNDMNEIGDSNNNKEIEPEDIPRLPSGNQYLRNHQYLRSRLVSPPTSPIPRDIRSPSNLPTQPDNLKRDSKSSNEEDSQSTTARSARLATRIPTPKSARSSNRTTLEPIKDLNGTKGDFPYSTKRDV
jgi:hypothetical protein